jgi:anti-anti-sigma regulatory factor
MNATFKQSGNKGFITLEGDLTLPNAEALKGICIKALLDADDVSIAMENVQNVDLSCLQLFCSAHRSAVRIKKHFAFSGSPPPAMRNAAKAAGYARLKGCKLDCEKSCLWMTVGADHE